MKMKLHLLLKSASGIALFALITACAGSSSSTATVDDSSASGAASAVVAAAIAESSSTGTLANLDQKQRPVRFYEWINPIKKAWAAGICPNLLTAAGSGCTNNTPNAGQVALTFGQCNYNLQSPIWAGTEVAALSAGSIGCGTFPTVTSKTLYHYYSSGASAATAARTSALGTTVTMDDATANLGNFDTGTTITGTITPSSSLYGTSVTFNGSGLRTGVSVYRHLIATSSTGLLEWNHSVAGSLSVSEGSGVRTLSGSLTVYHNFLQLVGTAVFSGVTQTDSCCNPTGGTVTTTFAAGIHVAPTPAGTFYLGKSETLTFSSTCGTATLTNASGSSSTVALGCY